MILNKMFGQIVPIRVKTLSNKNLVASRKFKIEKGSLPVDLRRLKTSLLKLPVGERTFIGRWPTTKLSKLLIGIGNTTAANLSTKMSTKLHIDTKYERFKKYVHNLHTSAVNGFSKTNSLLSEYNTKVTDNKMTSEKAMLVMK